MPRRGPSRRSGRWLRASPSIPSSARPAKASPPPGRGWPASPASAVTMPRRWYLRPDRRRRRSPMTISPRRSLAAPAALRPADVAALKAAADGTGARAEGAAHRRRPRRRGLRHRLAGPDRRTHRRLGGRATSTKARRCGRRRAARGAYAAWRAVGDARSDARDHRPRRFRGPRGGRARRRRARPSRGPRCRLELGDGGAAHLLPPAADDPRRLGAGGALQAVAGGARRRHRRHDHADARHPPRSGRRRCTSAMPARSPASWAYVRDEHAAPVAADRRPRHRRDPAGSGGAGGAARARRRRLRRRPRSRRTRARRCRRPSASTCARRCSAAPSKRVDPEHPDAGVRRLLRHLRGAPAVCLRRGRTAPAGAAQPRR